MKIEIYSNKIEKKIMILRENMLNFSDFMGKNGAIPNSSLYTHLIGWNTYHYTSTLKNKQTKTKKRKQKC